jgi:hypothetical protein
MDLTFTHLAVILALTGTTIAILGLVIGSIALLKCLSIERSTHTIQYMPVSDAIDKENEAYLQSLRENDWATTPETLKKQNELFKEDLEREMPEFIPTEDDSEIISF